MRYIVLIVILWNSFNSYPKPIRGEYIIKGQVYKDGVLVVNNMFRVNGVDVEIDDKGHFEFKIAWTTNDAYYGKRHDPNKKYLIIDFEGNSYRFRNRWKKYGAKNFFKDESTITFIDFNFCNKKMKKKLR